MKIILMTKITLSWAIKISRAAVPNIKCGGGGGGGLMVNR